jgi:hypothetical protein
MYCAICSAMLRALNGVGFASIADTCPRTAPIALP